ncbi:hypothetical protein MKW94_002165, partial [Papaver nudicaule]|nr:hypothetical protein [Papaver nudicaule]
MDSNQLLMKDDKVGIEAMRISHYCRVSAELAYMLGKSEAAFSVAMDFHNQAVAKIKEIYMLELGKEHGKDTEVEPNVDIEVPDVDIEVLDVDKDSSTAGTSRVIVVGEVPNAVPVQSTLPIMIMGDPRISVTKGRKPETAKGNATSNSRYKSGMEISKEGKKPRTCKYCTLTGHDSRNCEKNKADKLHADNLNGVGMSA